jgi:hypothetical protein
MPVIYPTVVSWIRHGRGGAAPDAERLARRNAVMVGGGSAVRRREQSRGQLSGRSPECSAMEREVSRGPTEGRWTRHAAQ